ncbi:hypothetical protein SESBI_30982 [Sesbania bispinosa]|nr:hypothetical protein SESBI_30982 [Sesbania bispinosa]
MATLKVPAQVPSPAEDSEQLRKAFQGYAHSFISFDFFDFNFVIRSSICSHFSI